MCEIYKLYGGARGSGVENIYIGIYAFRCSINNNLNLTVWETTTVCADDKKKNKKETAEREKHAKFVVPAGARYAINNYNQLKSWFIFFAGNVAAAARGCKKEEKKKKNAREGRVGGYIVPPSIQPAHKPTHPPNPPPLIHPSHIYPRHTRIARAFITDPVHVRYWPLTCACTHVIGIHIYKGTICVCVYDNIWWLERQNSAWSKPNITADRMRFDEYRIREKARVRDVIPPCLYYYAYIIIIYYIVIRSDGKDFPIFGLHTLRVRLHSFLSFFHILLTQLLLHQFYIIIALIIQYYAYRSFITVLKLSFSYW